MFALFILCRASLLWTSILQVDGERETREERDYMGGSEASPSAGGQAQERLWGSKQALLLS